MPDARPAVTTILTELRKERQKQRTSIDSLAQGLGVSKPTVSRWLKGQGLTLEALDDICNLLGTDMRALIERAQDTRNADRFSLRQERILASNRNLSLIFFLILNGTQRDALVETFGFPPDMVEQWLERLAKLGLISITRNRKLRPLISRAARWRPGGPLAVAFERTVKDLFLKADFGAPDTLYVSQLVPLDARDRQFVMSRFKALCEEIMVTSQARGYSSVASEWSTLFMMTRPIAVAELVDWVNAERSTAAAEFDR